MFRSIHTVAIGLAVLAAGVLAALAVAQQTTTPPAQPSAQPSAQPPSPPPVEAPEAITPQDLAAFEPYARTFRVLEGPGGETDTVRLERRQDGIRWVLTVGERLRLYLARREDGALVLTRMDLLQQNRAALYEPSVVFIPSRLEAGTAIEQQGQTTVYDLQTGEQTYQGTYTHRIEDVSRMNFNTPVGQMKGYLAAYEHTVNLDVGTLDLDMETGWVPDTGLVYLRRKSTFETLGLFGTTTLRTLVLAEEPAADGDAAPAAGDAAAPADGAGPPAATPAR